MIELLVVPLDGSTSAWRAFEVSLVLARRLGCDIRLVEVVPDPEHVREARDRLDGEVGRRDDIDVAVAIDVRLSGGTVADELAAIDAEFANAVVVMSSHGKGRSAAIVGSVTEDLLRRVTGPVVLVGPRVEVGELGGPVVVSVDGSDESETALAVAADWASWLDVTPWIVHVTSPDPARSLDGDVVETAYPSRLALRLAEQSGRPVEYDELHGRHPADAVTEYATRHGASMIVASSHGRSGLSRLTMGSVTAGFVRHATCPVTVVRLP